MPRSQSSPTPSTLASSTHVPPTVEHVAPAPEAASSDGPALPGALPGSPSPLIGVFGTPSSMTHWGIHVVRTVVGAAGGDHGIRHGNYLAEFAEAQSVERRPAAIICTSDCPEVRLCGFVLRSGAPVIIFAEDPADIIDDLVAVSGVDHMNALRLATRSLCALQPLMEAADTVVIGKGHLDMGMAAFVDLLVSALRIAATPQQRAEMDLRLAFAGSHEPGRVRDHVAHLFPVFAKRRREVDRASSAVPAPESASPDPAALEAAAGAFEAEAFTVLSSAAASPDAAVPAASAVSASGVKTIALCYEGLAAGAPLEQAEWPAAIFSSGDKIGDFVAGPCDLTGPARIVVYGPYMHLPLGDWFSRVEIEVAENESGNRLKVDLVCGPRVLLSASADMPTRGQYGFSLPFTISEPLDPVELRFQIESGAIEGRFLLRRVVMTRQASQIPASQMSTSQVAAPPLLAATA